jgi:hypothetical protein
MVLIVLTFSSCRVPYEPDIEADEEILVVDALITNHIGTSYVRLSMAIPYAVSGNCPSVENATVYLTDGKHNLIAFSETSPGYYEPDNAFAGEINVTYKLTVKMPDGDVYVSEPEIIPEDLEPDSAYGGYDQVEYITKDEFGKTVKVTEDVCAIYLDYAGDSVTPRFRYNNSQLIEWRLEIAFLWKTETDNSLRFTNEKYTSSTINIYKQEVSMSPPSTQMLVFALIPCLDNPDSVCISDSLITHWEYKRIVEVNQYRLNDDSYEYYKKVKAQSEAEGKLFDPVISPFKGNLSCVNESSKSVLGLFEASNLITMSYVIDRHGVGSEVTITRIDNLPPHSPAGMAWDFDNMPDFWVQ